MYRNKRPKMTRKIGKIAQMEGICQFNSHNNRTGNPTKATTMEEEEVITVNKHGLVDVPIAKIVITKIRM